MEKVLKPSNAQYNVFKHKHKNDEHKLICDKKKVIKSNVVMPFKEREFLFSIQLQK